MHIVSFTYHFLIQNSSDLEMSICLISKFDLEGQSDILFNLEKNTFFLLQNTFIYECFKYKEH